MDTFWQWLIKGSEKSVPGLRNLWNWYLLLHGVIALLCCLLIKVSGFEFAGTALFPASSILVGISLAWTTRAAAIFQSDELRKMLFNEKRPAEDYIYGFQLAIFTIIVMVAYTAIMAAGGVSITVFGTEYDRLIATYFLYFMMSLSVRECWGVVNFTNMMVLLDIRR